MTIGENKKSEWNKKYNRGTLFLNVKNIVFVAASVYITILSAACYAAKPTPPPASQTEPQKGGADIEKLIKTMNDTLKENRELREHINAIQQAYEKSMTENMGMKNKIILLEKNAKEIKQMQPQNADLEKQQALMAQIEAEKKNLQEKTASLENDLESVKQKNDELKTVLDQAILETERDEYKKMIQDAQKNSEEAVSEISAISLENERMRTELEQSYFRIGINMFESKNYIGAIDCFKKVIELNPNNSWAHYNLGIIYDFFYDDHPTAIYHYKRYLRFQPLDEDARRIHERIISMELQKNLIPPYPLKLDYNQSHRNKN